MKFYIRFEIQKRKLFLKDEWALMVIFCDIDPLVGEQVVASWDHAPDLEKEVNPIIMAVEEGIKAYARCEFHERYKEMFPIQCLDNIVWFVDETKEGIDSTVVVPYEKQ